MRRSLRWWLLVALLAVSVTAGATTYPLRVIDLAGREVVVPRPPQRIFVQNGNALTVLSLLDRENPFARVAGWNNTLGQSDPSIWALMRQRWPAADAVPTLNFDSAGHVDLEALVRLKPDLVLLDIETRPAVEGGRIAAILARLQIPTLYIDTARDPVTHLQKTLALLGRVLDREARAEAYLDFYRQRLAVLQAVAAEANRRSGTQPSVFIEVRAGGLGLDQCCYSQGKTGWGLLIDAVGGRNIASQLLAGATGDIALETLIRLQPDVYLMTGTQRVRRGARSIPFGYGAPTDEARSALAALMARPGFGATGQKPGACVHAIHHQFYDSAFHIVALEYLAQALYPSHFTDLRPDETYREVLRRFTTLPDTPFLFHLSRAYADGAPCER